MGWCGGTDVYLAAVDAFDILIGQEQVPDVAIINAWRKFAEALGEQDWDCESEALDQLRQGTWAYDGLALAMGKNLNCPGTCFDISCDEAFCGCPCHPR